MRAPYPSDLSDAEWALLAPLLPPPRSTGRPRQWPDRLIADAVVYVPRSGRAWRMLPREVPPWPTVSSRFRRWRLDGATRRTGRKRHLLVDALGLVRAVCVHAADVQGVPSATARARGTSSRPSPRAPCRASALCGPTKGTRARSRTGSA